MKPKKTTLKKFAPYLILAGAGIAGYLIYKRYFKNDGETTTPPPALPPAGTTTTTINPLGSTDEVKKFQDWLDINHPGWLNGGNLNKGNGYGNFGANTQAAYNTYKDAYAAPVTPAQTTTTTPTEVPALKVGDYCDFVKNTNGYTSSSMVKKYEYGGTGIKAGQWDKGYYAGKIIAIDNTYKSAKVQNTTYPAAYYEGSWSFSLSTTPDFWVSIDSLKKK